MTLTRAVGLFLSSQLLATLWAAVYRLPYEFGGHGAPDHVLRDFWSHGTALSAPALFLVALGLLSMVAGRRGRLGSAATAIVIVLMVIGLVTGVLEPALRRALQGGFPLFERTGILILTAMSLAATLLVGIVAVRHLRERLRTSVPGA